MIFDVEQPPLVATRLSIPPLRRQWIPRPRLLEQINLEPEISLVLVSAPAGFGKTTLLAELAGSIQCRPDAHAGWISLDDGDNDPVRLFGYLIAALERAYVEAADFTPVRAALPSISGPGWEGCLALLVNELERCGQPGLLVLDDYHLIHAPAVHSMLAWLIERLPLGVCLAIGSRSTPPFPLSRLRARGKMIELRAADLRFTAQEAADFIRQATGLEMGPADLAALNEGCEGWAAGIQLTALALQAQRRAPAGEVSPGAVSGPAGLMGQAALPGRTILNYLIDEVFAQQSAQIQEFLLKTSLLERLCAPLCAALMAGDPSGAVSTAGSQAALEALEADNLFTTRLDDAGTWFRYHRLFAGALRARLDRQHPEWAPDLHRRASEWFAGQGLDPEAIQHALAVPDIEKAAALLERIAGGMLARGELAQLETWLKMISPAAWMRHPGLEIVQAWIEVVHGDILHLEEHITAVETNLAAMDTGSAGRAVWGKASALRAFITLNQGDPAATSAAAEAALQALAPQDLFWRGVASRVLGEAHLRAGDFDAGCLAISQSSEISLAAGDLLQGLSAVSQVAGIQSSQAHLRLAETTYRQAFERVRRDGWESHPYVGLLHAGLGGLMLEWNRLDEAGFHLETAYALGAGPGFRPVALGAMLALARLQVARGDIGAAMAWLHQLQEEINRQLPPGAPSPVDALVARYALAVGDGQPAARWAERSGLHLGDPVPFGREGEYLTLALLQVWRARQDPTGPWAAEAVPLLERLAEATLARGQVCTWIEAQIGMALAYAAQHQPEAACSALEAALVRAQPEGFVRVFLDYGAALRDLLLRERRLLSASREGPHRRPLIDYCDTLLSAFDGRAAGQSLRTTLPPSSPDREPLPVIALSEREREVLLLVARGASNQEIADRLVLSLATVKSHVNHIMNKLLAQNRLEAVSRARDLGWIP